MKIIEVIHSKYKKKLHQKNKRSGHKIKHAAVVWKKKKKKKDTHSKTSQKSRSSKNEERKKQSVMTESLMRALFMS